MKELDRKLREALEVEDAELLQAMDSEPSVFEFIFDSFRGRERWLMMLSAFWMIVFLVLGVVSAVQAFAAEQQRAILLWGAGVLVSILAVATIKIMWWMELTRNALTREIKRLELQVARLASRLPVDRSGS